ncbi:type VI secretion protein IcmF/TssM N-terminal domain-containing protein [Azospirillum sp.]|uniref:type VI secretion protein IcmF/TssM N-terminal domain-containing protein n=1 Tax=Azospirillum sp. TaxID=34012 RepID=UPI003D75BF3A
MVLLMVVLEMLLSAIGTAIATLLPYALVGVPLYVAYRIARAAWPRLAAALRPPAKAGAKPRPKAAAAVRKAPAPLRIRREAPPAPAAASTLAPLARVYGEGLDILKRQMRGPLRRGDIPWFVAFGVGGPALLATDPTHVRWPEDGNGEAGAWWFCEGAAILHAGTDSADGARLDEAWPALLAAMRARPMRRPLDGVLLMVGADELRAAAQRDAPRAALVRRAAALRERLRALQDGLGVVCPVHVVVTRAEALDGFADLCAAVPAGMLDGALGWTNPHDWADAFDPRWVDAAAGALHADLARLEADALAAGTARPGLLLLPLALDAARDPLALFLEGVLRPTEGAEPFPLHGIALTGAHSTVTGGRRPVFARDLLPGRALAEAGYGRPSDRAFRTARRRRRHAQGALAASVVALSAMAWQGAARVAEPVPAVTAGVADLRKGLAGRDGVGDPQVIGRILAATAQMEHTTLATPLLPTSLLSRLDEDKRRLAAATVRRAVLRPIRDALLPRNGLADMPPVADPRRVEDLPGLRRLSDQIDRVSGRRAALDRYERFRRRGHFSELVELSDSVFGHVRRPAVPASDTFTTRIAAGADLPDLDARAIAAAVRAESVRLAEPLAEELYTRSPLRVRAEALADRLRALPEEPSAEDAAEVRRLVERVTDAAAWPISNAVLAPASGLPEAVKALVQRAAIGELPGRDAAERIVEMLSTAGAAARADLLALEAPHVGRLFVQSDGGPALAVSPTLAALPDRVAEVAASRPEAPAPAPAPPPEPEPAKPAPAAKAPAPPPQPPVEATPKPDPVPAPPAVAEKPEATPAVTMAPPPTPIPRPAPDRLPEAADATLAKLGAAFSEMLAGRFPFVRPDRAGRAPDADPEDVRQFYRLLDAAKAPPGRTLPPELKAFADRMDAARPLLEAALRPAGMTVELTYGVNRAAEVGAEHIIDWSVRSGTSAVGAGGSGNRLAWSAGQPILLSFRWAAGSPFRPKSAASGGTPAMAGDTLTVVEHGPWALLRLLKGRAQPGAPASEAGALIRMVLPTETIAGLPARDTVLFLAASVTANGKAPTPLRLPDLPAAYPHW